MRITTKTPGHKVFESVKNAPEIQSNPAASSTSLRCGATSRLEKDLRAGVSKSTLAR
jgi:hypothetical protein